MSSVRLPLLTSLVLAGLAATATAQNARPTTNLSNNVSLPEVAAFPATKGDNSLVLSLDQALMGRTTLNCYVSDGRGIDWSPAIPISSANSTPKTIRNASYVQFGRRNVYCIWEEGADLFFSRSTDGGASWRVARSISDGAVGPARMCVAEGASVGTDELYILVRENGNGRLRLISSVDSGRNFRRRFLTDAGQTIGEFDVRGTGERVHVAYVSDAAGSDDVYYTRSSDGGRNFDVAATVIDPSGAAAGDASGSDIHLALDGDKISVAMLDDVAGGAPQGLYVNTSLDAGVNFVGAVAVGDYALGVDTVFGQDLQRCGSNLVACWSDDRNGGEEVFAAFSSDDGATWTETAALGSGQSVRAASLAPVPAQGCGFAYSRPEDGRAFVALSKNDGLGFRRSRVSDTDTTEGDAELSYNALYNNFVVSFRAVTEASGVVDTYVGGARPQTLIPIDWVSGPTDAGFRFVGFKPGTSQAWAIGSFSAGNLALPDGRNLGISYDVLTAVSVNLAISGTWAADLNNGVGNTPTLFQNFSGIQFRFIGVGFDDTDVTEVTDVVEINL